MYEIKKIDINFLPAELFTFCQECSRQGIINNSSIEAMKIGRWNNDAWWATWIDGKIISVSGAHALPEISDHCWRVMVRTATLPPFRALAGPVSKTLSHDFNWGKILPYQIKHAIEQGADKIVFTTNSSTSGDLNSYRMNSVVEKTLAVRGLVTLIKQDIILFHTVQNVWEVL